MAGARIMVPLGLSIAFAFAAVIIAPRAFEAESLLAARDDPVALAEREINAARAAKDADLGQSFLELAREQKLAVDPDLAAKVALANSGAATAGRSLESFGRGLITGEPDDLSGLAGTAVGDLFVFG